VNNLAGRITIPVDTADRRMATANPFEAIREFEHDGETYEMADLTALEESDTFEQGWFVKIHLPTSGFGSVSV
jgi:hypothetical protein